MKEAIDIPAMTEPFVSEFLTTLGRNWTGHGVAIELGSWLGSSAKALLTGLVEARYDRLFYAYDRWQVMDTQVEKAKAYALDLKYGQDILPLFLENVIPIYPNIRVCKGNIQHTITSYDGGPIEICIFDAPKKNPVFGIAIKTLLPHWIPGITVIGLLDYYFYQGKPNEDELMEPVRLIESNPECFTKLIDWKDEEGYGGRKAQAAFFRYEKKLNLTQ